MTQISLSFYASQLMVGGSAGAIPDNIRIFNKPGEACGFKTDCAYIVDYENGVEFLLAATFWSSAVSVRFAPT
ncbi:MAG: hypothetical protein QNK16_09530 [Woeseiaceae bacterium]|nr:hypothetical protein [Woeseiaceae bacterium]MDX2608611.1 hypothetical protein [Woeseiaceae bacterium]